MTTVSLKTGYVNPYETQKASRLRVSLGYTYWGLLCSAPPNGHIQVDDIFCDTSILRP